ncbi:uncharacterized protein DFL_002917 [Arthrobotrys flagrans]|uniref:Cyanovirin-N domain-containing protein n=1 Tax=Arthrobotrys flagrans TaxID=97331 RepID=A0A437ABV0_ARTFL|nr:hypothetical protein DFL_002917 [Arthrobotrys flagrans]
MVGKSSLFLVASWLATVQATISSQCTNIRFQNRWLVGDCLTGSGTNRIESSVYLQTKITNHEGVLEWAINGNFAASCIDCSLSTSPLTLNCKCRPTGGQPVPASIALDEHIAVYNGFLLSDLAGTPTPPSVVSSVHLPEDPSWKLVYGNTSCYSDNPGTCPSPTVGNGITCSTGGTSVSASDGVSDCFAFRWPISFPVWATFGSLQVNAPSGAFRFNVYDTTNCSGGVKGTIEPNELGTCKAFNTQMLAFSAVPLWNGQT